ncbi:hypothetical protein N7456_008056 [Penicillium angulare]|uniref:SET domain-containing protein n=1 Tax=Penicillium angulare TaxID=116970 RepID=A0A9W9K8Z4_9EURO|nr:hypothetical protein N7456_008056 [Penicillium angulare]
MPVLKSPGKYSHNTSNSPPHSEALKAQTANSQHVKELKGQLAKPVKPRSTIILEFESRRILAHTSDRASINIKSSFISSAYPPCTVPLDKLRKAMIEDLRLETHNRGHYILLRTVTPTETMMAVTAIVEDEMGNVLTLQLYNQEKELAGPQGIEEGDAIVVKEPYVRVMADGNYGIRVDHLSDVNFVPKFHDLIPYSWREKVTEIDESPESWKEKGNKFFRQASYRAAIECYSKALEFDHPPGLGTTIECNRTLAFLNSGQFDAAILGVEKELSKPDPSIPSDKALFRKAQALYQLQRFSESCKTYKLLSERYPGSPLAQEELARASARLAEQNTGNYEFKKMLSETKERRPPCLDHATYIGPVAVKKTESHGNGLFTTAVVKAGDLLLCEKAFSYAIDHNYDPSTGLSPLSVSHPDRAFNGADAELIETITQKLHKNPSLLDSFLELHRGTYDAMNVQEVDGKPVVDTFLVEHIVDMNAFGSPISSRKSHISSRKGTPPPENENFQYLGIWPLASRMNHSCFNNACHSFIGDMMIIRATKDLAPNTEITAWYRSPFSSGASEKPVDLKPWGFGCDCIICQDIAQSTESILSTRKGYLEQLRSIFTSPRKPKARGIERLLSKVEETYSKPACEVPRLKQWIAYLLHAKDCAESNKPKEVVKFGLKALESLGYIIEGGNALRASDSENSLLVKTWGLMDDEVVSCWMMLARAYRLVAPALQARAVIYAKISYKICVGEDETFYKTYGQHSDRTDGLLPTARY